MPQRRAARSKERRRSARADARLSMRVEGRHQEGDSTQVVTESQNISSNGVYCTSTHYLAPLSKVALTIVLPRLPGSTASKELIKCDGIVVRCEPGPGRKSDQAFELACMFSDLDERRRGLLEEFVTWRNLQALRAAASGPNGERTRTSRAPAARKAARSRASARRRPVH